MEDNELNFSKVLLSPNPSPLAQSQLLPPTQQVISVSLSTLLLDRRALLPVL